MKNILKAIVIASVFVLPFSEAYAGDAFKKVESQYVCMVNNKLFDKPQIPVAVNGKTYYGCCPMCKEKLMKSADARTATDPVSGKAVDKAEAVIGSWADGTVHYFESEGNLRKFGDMQRSADQQKHHQ